MKKRVLLGMSGGVDSSVSAVLLQNEGYEVVGCTMILWKSEKNLAVEDAKKVCDKLGIKHYVFDFSEQFKCNVLNYFISEYQNANTPNPCIECNKFIKFGCFFDKAKELDCDYFATGHYARIEFSEKYNQYVLKKGMEEKKDQSYFLYGIPKEKLESIIFPLQDYTDKEEIRKIAKGNGLEVAEKKDSQEICFIPDNNYKRFLEDNIKEKSKNGNIVLESGKVLGIHNGLINYTVGQRKGIGVTYKEPLYVVKLDKNRNEVIVGIESCLYSDKLWASDVNWIIDVKGKESVECLAKIRYRAKEAKAKIHFETNGKVRVEFEQKQRAITRRSICCVL